MSKPRNDRKASITMAFDSPLAALSWFKRAKLSGLVPDEAALYQMDGLDKQVSQTGVPGANEFIVRREGDRPGEEITVEKSERVV